MIISVGWPEGVSPSGSHRSRRDNLSSPGSCHPVHRDPCTHARPDGFSLSHPTPPGSMLPVDRTNSPRMTRPLGSTPTAPSRGFIATTSRSASGSRDGTHCLAVQPLGRLPLALRHEANGSVGTRLPTFHAKAADRTHVAYMPDTAWPETRTPARLIPCRPTP